MADELPSKPKRERTEKQKANDARLKAFWAGKKQTHEDPEPKVEANKHESPSAPVVSKPKPSEPARSDASVSDSPRTPKPHVPSRRAARATPAPQAAHPQGAKGSGDSEPKKKPWQFMMFGGK
jgi:hypothetical protein